MKIKLIIATLSLLCSVSFAAKVSIPTSRINLYAGSFSDLEINLKQEIINTAIDQCGSLEDANIGRSKIILKLQSIYTHDVARGSDKEIWGSYPQVGAVVDISCR